MLKEGDIIKCKKQFLFNDTCYCLAGEKFKIISINFEFNDEQYCIQVINTDKNFRELIYFFVHKNHIDYDGAIVHIYKHFYTTQERTNRIKKLAKEFLAS